MFSDVLSCFPVFFDPFFTHHILPCPHGCWLRCYTGTSGSGGWVRINSNVLRFWGCLWSCCLSDLINFRNFSLNSLNTKQGWTQYKFIFFHFRVHFHSLPFLLFLLIIDFSKLPGSNILSSDQWFTILVKLTKTRWAIDVIFVTMHSQFKVLWRSIWWNTEKRKQTNVTIVTMHQLENRTWKSMLKTIWRENLINVTFVISLPGLNKIYKSTLNNILEKSHKNATCVVMHPFISQSWVNIWKYTAEKSHLNAPNATALSDEMLTWKHICKSTVEQI